MAETNIWPLRTAIPLKAMKPMAALTLKGNPLAHRASTPPMAAKGIPV
jgi:hypothetical protein